MSETVFCRFCGQPYTPPGECVCASDPYKKRSAPAAASKGPDIFMVILGGDVDRVKAFLTANPDAVHAVRDGDKFTPLLSAALTGNKAMLRAVLDRKPDLWAQSQDGDTVFHIAARKGHKPSLDYLREVGARRNIKNNAGQLPIDVAAEPIKKHMRSWPPEEGAEGVVERPPAPDIHLLVHSGDVERVRAALATWPEVLNAVHGSDGFTPVMTAISTGNKAMVRLFINAGADLRRAAWNGDSVMHLAARKGHIATLDLLHESGVSHSALNKGGRAPIQCADAITGAHMVGWDRAVYPNKEGVDYFSKISCDVVQHIFGFLPPPSLAVTSRVCRAWSDATNDESFWHHLHRLSEKNSVTAKKLAASLGSVRAAFLYDATGYLARGVFVKCDRGHPGAVVLDCDVRDPANPRYLLNKGSSHEWFEGPVIVPPRSEMEELRAQFRKKYNVPHWEMACPHPEEEIMTVEVTHDATVHTIRRCEVCGKQFSDDVSFTPLKLPVYSE